MKRFKSILFLCVIACCNTFVSTAQQFVTSVEAEAGIRGGGLTIATANAGYSGSGYITNMNNTGDNLTVSVTVPTAGNYSLVIRYNGPYGTKDQDVYVNGQFVSALNFPQTATYTDLTAGSLLLNAGVNTISIHKNWGYTDFDKFSLYTVALHDYTTVAASPIDPAVTPEAKALYNYLKSSYGQSIISGQTSDFYPTVSPNAAKKPVVRAYDFQHYTVGYSYLWNNATASHAFGWEDDGTTQAAIDWYNSTCQKGMVAFQWHWHSPTGGQAGTNTFYTNQTNFDVLKAVTQGTPEYTAVIRDIDSIATQLKKLQTAGVPVLWRPLHEAGGAWFWWGAKGAAPCLALWDMVYNRITNYHNIHNLIWQWSTPEPSWYPGNAKVDMLGYDSYPGAYNYGTQKLIFDQLYTIVNGQKMLAMTENGPIPDPDACFSSDAKWSYFMSWSDLVTQQNSAAQLNLVYNHAKVITLDEVSVATNKAQLTAVGPTSFCTGGSVLLKANVAKGYTYKWYNGTNLIAGATSATYTAIAAGSYTVAVTATGACTTTSAAIVVTVGGPTAIITPATTTTFCQGGSVVLNANTGSGYTYQWNVGGNPIVGATNVSYTTNTTGMYSVKVTASTCNTTSVGTQVTVNAPPTATISTGPNTSCQGITVLMTASAGTFYKWMLNGTAISGATNATFVATSTGPYSVEVTNASNCKAVSLSLSFPMATVIPITISPIGSASFCQGGSVVLVATTGTAYKWMLNGNTIIGATNSSYAASVMGAYTVEVTYGPNNCKEVSAAVNVTEVSMIATITPAGSTTFCQGGSVVLSSTMGVAYKWMLNGNAISTATNSTYTVIATGSYTVELTYGPNNCKSISAAVQVNVTNKVTWYLDSDGDGKGDPAATVQACTQPNGYVAIAGDACPNDVTKIAPGNCGCGVTENSCLDCMGVPNGTAALDVCNVCAGGTSGITPKTNISQCGTTATVSSLAAGLKVYPNPSATEFMIEVSSGTFTATIYNAAGLKVSSNTYETNATVGANLPQGIYMVYIEQDGNVELRKLVKE